MKKASDPFWFRRKIADVNVNAANARNTQEDVATALEIAVNSRGIA